jgi:uncharacterized repeat protein (TIGR02543 family)
MKNWKRIFTVAAIVAIFGFAACGGGGGDEEFTVTFNLEGGNIDGNTASVGITVNSGEKIDNLPDPKKTDCTFGGWFTEKNGNGNAFTENTPVTANITVYAKWTLDLVEQTTEPLTFGANRTITIKYMALPDADVPTWVDKLVTMLNNMSGDFFSGNYTLTVSPEGIDGFAAADNGKVTVSEAFLTTKPVLDISNSIYFLIDNDLWKPEVASS